VSGGLLGFVEFCPCKGIRFIVLYGVLSFVRNEQAGHMNKDRPLPGRKQRLAGMTRCDDHLIDITITRTESLTIQWRIDADEQIIVAILTP